MATLLNLQDLVDALEWVSGGGAAALDCEAFVSRDGGKVHWSGDGADEELPPDIADEGLYIPVPSKHDLDLGRSLAIRFAEEFVPDLHDDVREYFRKPGAYSRFKTLLDRAGKLEAWFEYEKVATDQALRKWCEENDLELEDQK